MVLIVAEREKKRKRKKRNLRSDEFGSVIDWDSFSWVSHTWVNGIDCNWCSEGGFLQYLSCFLPYGIVAKRFSFVHRWTRREPSDLTNLFLRGKNCLRSYHDRSRKPMKRISNHHFPSKNEGSPDISWKQLSYRMDLPKSFSKHLEFHFERHRNDRDTMRQPNSVGSN